MNAITAEIARLSAVVDALRAKAIELNAQANTAAEGSVEQEIIGAMYLGVSARQATVWEELQALRAEVSAEADL
jgi:hypothetical protein